MAIMQSIISFLPEHHQGFKYYVGTDVSRALDMATPYTTGFNLYNVFGAYQVAMTLQEMGFKVTISQLPNELYTIDEINKLEANQINVIDDPCEGLDYQVSLSDECYPSTELNVINFITQDYYLGLSKTAMQARNNPIMEELQGSFNYQAYGERHNQIIATDYVSGGTKLGNGKSMFATIGFLYDLAQQLTWNETQDKKLRERFDLIRETPIHNIVIDRTDCAVSHLVYDMVKSSPFFRKYILRVRGEEISFKYGIILDSIGPFRPSRPSFLVGKTVGNVLVSNKDPRTKPDDMKEVLLGIRNRYDSRFGGYNFPGRLWMDKDYLK